MRETIAYNLFREMGLPASRTGYVNLYVNNSLRGLYTLIEQVDGEFLEDNFSNPDGDLYKPDSTDATNGVGHDLLWIDDDYSSYTAVELKTNEDSTDNALLINFLDELNNGNDHESIMDVDEILRYIAVSTALSNLDSYQGSPAHNYYLYEDSNRFSVVPWDLNETFGTFARGCTDDEITALYIDEPTSGTMADRPLIEKLLQGPNNLDSYHSYYDNLINGSLDPDVLENTINSIAALIRADVYADPTAFYSGSQFEAGLTSAVDGAPGLLSFTTERTANIANQLSGVISASGDGSGSCSGGNGRFPGP